MARERERERICAHCITMQSNALDCIGLHCYAMRTTKIPPRRHPWRVGPAERGVFWFGNYHHDFVRQHMSTLKVHQIISMACGCDHTLALSSCGNILAWGRNTEGQLGIETRNCVDSSSLQIIALNVGIKQIACGTNHSLLLCNNGNIYSFGSNKFGQLGIGF